VLTTDPSSSGPRLFAGVDVGKAHHWVCLIDQQGRVVLSRKVANDEMDLAAVVREVTASGAEVTWAVDIVDTLSVLLLTLLTIAGQDVRYVAGRVVNTMSTAYVGEGKTDAKDAYVIAETARVRRGLPVTAAASDGWQELMLLTARRADLVADRVRMLNRLRSLLTSVAPVLERAFEYSTHKGALVLLTGYPTPQRLTRMGQTRLTEWLRARRVRGSAQVAERAIAAARAQQVRLPGQDVAAALVVELATDILALDERLKTLEAQLTTAFRTHPHARSIESMPGFGPVLGAMLLTAAGDLSSYPDPGHLAAAAGLVPVPKDSGRRVGNVHKPRRYSRPLRHALYLSALSSLRTDGVNRDDYQKKRDAGRTHKQALIALARRRVDVLWALIRDHRTYTAQPPQHTPAAA
jgi:transposase